MQNDTETRSLDFVDAVRDCFAFLRDYGFREMESEPTLVRFGKGVLVIDLHHGRQSDAVDVGLSWQGCRYSLSEVIRAKDPIVANAYRSETATTLTGLQKALGRLRELVTQYAGEALQGDEHYLAILDANRKTWLENYALEVRAGQLRPQAESAFRLGNYRKAVELYEQFEAILSPVELKKVALARKRLAASGSG